METVNIDIGREKSFTLADRAARKMIGGKVDDLLLVGWWDSVASAGGPVEACGDENHGCVTTYAESHGAAHRVLVNGGEYEFYYAVAPGDTQGLDASSVVDVHRNLVLDSVENLQGG
jgi:hypothetical protein